MPYTSLSGYPPAMGNKKRELHSVNVFMLPPTTRLGQRASRDSEGAMEQRHKHQTINIRLSSSSTQQAEISMKKEY